jgi:ribonuclease Z
MFSARLVNDPFGDPAVFLDMRYRREALLFDLGDIRALPPRMILKVDRIFVTHTHMDHFIGFDHLLRVCLGREKHLFLYGPPGFIDNVEGKLRAYTWNLVENYENDFRLWCRRSAPAAWRPRFSRAGRPFALRRRGRPRPSTGRS